MPGTFTLRPGATDPEIEISTGSFAGGWWAQTSWSCVIATGLYSGNEVTIQNNMTTISGLSTQHLRRIAIHEMGRAYGLDHAPSDFNASDGQGVSAVMRGDS